MRYRAGFSLTRKEMPAEGKGRCASLNGILRSIFYAYPGLTTGATFVTPFGLRLSCEHEGRAWIAESPQDGTNVGPGRESWVRVMMNESESLQGRRKDDGEV